MTLMLQSAFAAHRGVGKSAVSNWKKAGLLVFAEGEDGKPKVDVERSDARINARIDPMRGRPQTGVAPAPAGDADEAVVPIASGKSLGSARNELLAEQLIGQRLKNGAAAGDLVPRLEAERRLGELGRAIRERVHGLHRGLAERLAAERDPRTIDLLLGEETDKLFIELADMASAGIFAGGEDDGAEEEEPQAEAA